MNQSIECLLSTTQYYHQMKPNMAMDSQDERNNAVDTRRLEVQTPGRLGLSPHNEKSDNSKQARGD